MINIVEGAKTKTFGNTSLCHAREKYEKAGSTYEEETGVRSSYAATTNLPFEFRLATIKVGLTLVRCIF